MRRFIQTVCVSVAVTSLVAGCDWRKLDQAVERAPVLSVSPPSGYLGADVGRLVVALPPPADKPEVSARYFVASITKVAAALIELDAQGRPTVYNVPDSILGGLNSAIIGSVALASRPDEPFPSVLLGVPEFKTGEFKNGAMFRLRILPGAAAPTFVLDPAILPLPGLSPGGATPGSAQTGPFVGYQGFGRGIASGAVAGDPNFEDWVVVGNAGVSLIEDGAAAVPAVITPASLCQLDFSPLRLDHLYQLSRNPAIADIIPSLPGGEIAVGVPNATGPGGGKVVILTREATGPLGCPITLTVPGVPGFGSSVVAGDVNGDAAVDLLVGAPLDKVYVFVGPFVPGVVPAPAFIISAPANAQTADFGARIALMELDAVPGPEILIAAPGFVTGGQAAAGAVFAFKADGSAFSALPFTDHNPDANANLGEGLAVVPFRNPACVAGPSRPLLVAGANEEVFAYFQLPGALPDARCFPAP